MGAEQARVLVVEDDPDVRLNLRTVLQEDGLCVAEAADGLAALYVARSARPDLILLDLGLPGLSGAAVRGRLRSDHRTRWIPIVIVSAVTEVRQKVAELAAGADDYITKPYDVEELVSRVRASLRRSQTLRDLNPLSGLPGNAPITTELATRIASGDRFAVLHIDLDDFKCFNDRYGFTTGDMAIGALARSIEETLERVAEGDAFVGHVGGDDFVVICPLDEAERLAKELCDRFDVIAAGLHDDEDRARGWYLATDRRGQTRQLPLLSISIGVAPSTGRTDQSAAEITHIAAEMKEVAKRRLGSTFAMDRRSR